VRCESVNRWVSNFPDRPNTRRNYLYRLGLFVEWSGKDPDALIEEAKVNPVSIHDQMKSFYNSLIEKGNSSKTAVLTYQCLRSFYRWNNIILGRTPRGFRGRVEFEPYRVLTPSEIANMVNCVTSIRDKALIAFLAQSGQRVGVLTALRYSHVRLCLEKDEHPLIIEARAILRDERGVNVNKLGESYQFAVGDYTIRYLNIMIEERRKHGESLDDESWLFRSYSKSISKGGKKIPVRVSRSTRGRALTSVSIRDIVHKVAERAGLQRKASEKRYEIHPHIFRRYWNMRLQEAGLSEDLRNFMLGHRLPYEGAYSRWYPDSIRREWKVKNVEKYLAILNV